MHASLDRTYLAQSHAAIENVLVSACSKQILAVLPWSGVQVISDCSRAVAGLQQIRKRWTGVETRPAGRRRAWTLCQQRKQLPRLQRLPLYRLHRPRLLLVASSPSGTLLPHSNSIGWGLPGSMAVVSTLCVGPGCASY